MIDRDSPLPIYYQLKEMMKKKIVSGEWPPGSAIPSERELSDRYEISRMTVRQAVTELVREGDLIRHRGKGTFVAEEKIERALNQVTGFTEEMLRRGYTPKTVVKEFAIREADKGTAKALDLREGGLIYEVKRLRLADEVSMAFETSYLPVERIPGLTKERLTSSLFEYVEKELKMEIGYGRRMLEASIARRGESRLLGIPEGAPILFIRGVTYFADGKPMEIVESLYRGDRYTFTVELERSHHA